MFRHVVIVGGYLVLVMMGDEVPMKPTYTSKLNTFLQISLVIAVHSDKADWLNSTFAEEAVGDAVLGSTMLGGGP